MKTREILIPKKECFLCFEFTLGEFTEEQVKICAEHWLDAKNCPNWNPIKSYTIRKGKKVTEILLKVLKVVNNG